MASVIEVCLHQIQNLKELELTRRVLVPLFEALGYERVEYFGGSDEEGKDLVCWRKNEIGDIELTVAQVKKYRMSRNASISRSFHTIVNQLSQAIERRVAFVDGCAYQPEIIYLISPYPLDSKVINSRLEAYANLRARRVRIIDGPKLISLVREKLPGLFNELLGARLQIANAITAELTNKTLLAALEYPTRRGAGDNQSVESFYTDIDFTLLRPSARILFSADVSGGVHYWRLGREDWVQLNRLNGICLSAFGCEFLADRESLEKAFNAYVRQHARWEAEYQPAEADLAKLNKECSILEKRIRTEKKESVVLAVLMTEKKFFIDGVDEVATERLKSADGLPIRVASDCSDQESLSLAVEYGNALLRLREVEDRHRFLKKEEPKFNIYAGIDGSRLAAILSRRRGEIEAQITIINSSQPSIAALSEFLGNSYRFFEATRELLADPRILQSVGLDDSIPKRSFDARLAVPVHEVFSTGFNIALLGEAGAGKTTSLQMYAHKLIHSNRHQGLVIFAPLAALARAWRRSLGEYIEDGSFIPLFEEGLHLYLGSMGFAGTRVDLTDELKRNKGVLLLDGVDEVFKSIPWIVRSISSFAERTQGVQIIVSARSTGSYLDAFPFINIALLPFTDDQRTHFINRWFGGGDDERVSRILRHLEETPLVADIIKNPLLATILCVLAENDVPLPTSEVRLYEERLRLLLGHYDLHKRVRRVETHSSNLHLVARKLAFLLHLGGKRDDTLEELYKIAETGGLPADQCQRAVDELIDPCGILLAADGGERFGFGHLRYQEHLAAQEIAFNRGIPIVPLLEQEWWSEVFVLYAQMNQDVEAIVSRIAQTGQYPAALKTLLEMVGTLPGEKRHRLENPFGPGVVRDGIVGRYQE